MEIREGKAPRPSSEPLGTAEVTAHSINHGHCITCTITLLLSPEVGSAACITQPLSIWKKQLQGFPSSGVTAGPPVRAVTVTEQLVAVAPWAGRPARLGVQHQLIPLSWHVCGIHTMTRVGKFGL